MTEFEIQQLLIQSRWEFDVPNYVFIFLSLACIVMGSIKGGFQHKLELRLLQLIYLLSSLFLIIRSYAAIIRGQKLGGLLVQMDPVFEFWNPSLQSPTWYLRLGTWIVLLVATLFILERKQR